LQLRIGPGATGVSRDCRAAEAGRLDLAVAVSAVRPLGEVNEAFADLRSGAVIRTVLRP